MVRWQTNTEWIGNLTALYRALPDVEKRFATMHEDAQWEVANVDLPALENSYERLLAVAGTFSAEERTEFEALTKLREETHAVYERLWAHQTLFEE